MKYIFFVVLLPWVLLADAPKPTPTPNVFVFSAQRPACSLIDGKLVLAKWWPLGSWEDCAYSVLSAALQLDKLRDDAVRQVNILQQLQSQKPKK